MSPERQEAVSEAWSRKDYRAVQTLTASAESPLAEAWKAMAAWKLGQRTAAEASLRLTFASLEPSTRNTLGSVLLESELAWPAEALAVAELLERIGVGLPLGLRLIAEELERQTQNPVEAFKVLARAKALDPNDAETDFALAALHARGGRAGRAMAALKDAIAHAEPGQDFRALARAHPDFAGLQSDPAFVELVDTRPGDPALQELATALDASSWELVVKRAKEGWRSSTDPVFVLRAWEEALHGLLGRGRGDTDPTLLTDLSLVERELDERDPEGTSSPAWRRFRPGR